MRILCVTAVAAIGVVGGLAPQRASAAIAPQAVTLAAGAEAPAFVQPVDYYWRGAHYPYRWRGGYYAYRWHGGYYRHRRWAHGLWRYY